MAVVPTRWTSIVHDESVVEDPDAAMALEPGAYLDRYRILELIGTGGVGVVYAAADEALGRKVAIKLLRPSIQSSAKLERRRARLIREAQALARLSHPNVVPVYEVGLAATELPDCVYVVMEFVEGLTMRAWLDRDHRPWDEILATYLQAGRGLAAAHEAEIIHRDFKPENVLVGHDGRVRVVDFGLATPVPDPIATGRYPTVEDQQLALERTGRGRTDDLVRRRLDPDDSGPSSGPHPILKADAASLITAHGKILGTPAYMSPEQSRGEPIDARSDQYSFCVAVWEALVGERPHGPLSSTSPSRAHRRARGAVDVPVAILSTLERGLSLDPDDRFPDMNSLLAALDQRPTRRLRWLAFVGVPVLAAIASSFAVLGPPPEDTCRRDRPALAGIWDDEVRARVHRQLTATPRPHAEASWNVIERELDRWSSSWLDARVDACEAGDRVGPGSGPNPRTSCLDHQAATLRSLTERLADASVADDPLDDALVAVLALPDPERCRRVHRVASEPTAAATLANGLALAQLGRTREAEAELRAAVFEGQAAGLDDVTIEACIALIELDGSADWAALGLATLARIGGDPQLEDQLRSASARVAIARGDDTSALAEQVRVLELRERRHGHDHVAVASALVELAATQQRLGRLAEAELDAIRALTILTDELGVAHPRRALALRGYGSLAHARGDHRTALSSYLDALAIVELTRGRDAPELGEMLRELAAIHSALGQPEHALAALERADELGSTQPQRPRK